MVRSVVLSRKLGSNDEPICRIPPNGLQFHNRNVIKPCGTEEEYESYAYADQDGVDINVHDSCNKIDPVLS